MEDRRFYVYVKFRPWNGMPCYVGKGSGKRHEDHERLGERHYNAHLANILKKAGGSLPTVIVRKGLSNSEACALEIELISAMGRSDLGRGPLANMTDGGDGVVGRSGWKHSAETRAKIGRAHKGRSKSNQHREALRAHWENLSPEEMGLFQKNVKHKIEQMSQEQKMAQSAKLSISHLGWYQKMTPEQRAAYSANMSAAKKGKPYPHRTPQACANMSAAAKAREARKRAIRSTIDAVGGS